VVVASIPTAENWSHSSIMEHGARHVHQEAVICVRKCGALFNSMPELAKNRNAICQDAGMVRSFFSSLCNTITTHRHQLAHMCASCAVRSCAIKLNCD
jgi:hypothetical protein